MDDFENDRLTEREMNCCKAGAVIMGKLIVSPKVVAVHSKQVIVRWRNGTINKSTCAKDDKFDAEIGYAICLLKHAYKGKKGKAMLADILAEIRYQDDAPKKKVKKIKKVNRSAEKAVLLAGGA
jgi:hypothetical protein